MPVNYKKKSIEEIWRPGVTVDVCGTVQWNVGGGSSIFLLKDGGVGGMSPWGVPLGYKIIGARC